MERLKQEIKNLDKLYKETKEDKYLYRRYDLDHLFEISLETYEAILKYCKEHNVLGIIDIGCAFGYQSEMFLLNNIDYIGVECSLDYFWNEDRFKYIKGKYPCKIENNNNYLGVSSMCISWECYLDDGLETLYKQFKKLSEDFKKCLIYGQKDNMPYANKYFKKVEKLDYGLYELSNE